MEDSPYTLKDFATQDINRISLSLFFHLIEYDYSDIVYPIPFQTLFHHEETHYVNFGKSDSRFPAFIELGTIHESSFEKVDFIYVTGSSSNHLYSNVNTMYSLMRACIDASIVFVDFGLDEPAFSYLLQEMEVMHSIFQKHHSLGRLYYRKFDFSHFPAWFDITNEQIRGGYSWKVISYFDVLVETKRMIVWSDGGNQLVLSIEKELQRARTYGLFSPYSGGSLQSWVHGKSLRFLAYNGMVRKIMTGKGMCTGGYLFVNYRNETVMKNVIFPLVQCAYTRRCISPEGSSRKNHRQDQAILSVLIHSTKVPESCKGSYNTKVRYHQECDSVELCKPRKDMLVNQLNQVIVS